MNLGKEIESSLDNSIVSDQLINITSELTEVGFDAILEEGVLKDLPIIGIFLGLTKVGISIHDKLFLKKILRFLFHLKEIPAVERLNFIKHINADNKYKTKVGEKLMLILDKLDDYTKAEYLGKLFAYSIKGRIDYNMFLRLSSIIDKSLTTDLQYLLPFYYAQNEKVAEIEQDLLYNLGVLKNLGVDGGTFLYQRNEDALNKKLQLEINIFGKLIVELLLLENDDRS